MSALSAPVDSWEQDIHVGMPVLCGVYLGAVSAIRGSSFDARFAWPEPMPVQVRMPDGSLRWLTQTHFSRRFRKKDGRSMGEKVFSWAQRVPAAQG